MTTAAVKRACDACHRRKVKCDGITPCRNCSASQLACTYNAVPQKKGPKGSRAKVINELKETQRQTSLSAKLQGGMNGGASSPTLAPTPRLLTKETLKACIDFFFAHMYPTMPILERHRLEQDAMYMDQNLDTYCLLTSLCSFVCLQPGMVMPGAGMNDPFNPDMFGANMVTSTLLMEETIRVRKGYDYVASPTVNSLCTSYFLFSIHHGLEMHDKAWFHLREASTLAHMVRMNEEQAYLQYDSNDSIDASRRRRLYWLLFVCERAYALQHRRPLSLQASINLPSPQDHPADPFLHNGTSTLRMIGLFRGFDESLVPLWTKARGESSESYLAALDKQLREVLPPYLNDTQAQLAEMSSNQQWLKHKAWGLSVASGNGNSADASYVDTIHELLPVVSHFPGNLGLHGLSLCEHLFTVTCALTEILAILPAPRTPFTPGPQDQLCKILNIVTVIRNGDHRFLPLLLSKVALALPKLASPMLQNAPETAPTCNMDIFDGFGNSGMCQPPVYSGDFDNKFAVPRFDEMNSDSNSPNGPPPSSNDMNSPFASSPAIMSPGIELPHGLQTDFSSMPDMVMSPISHAPPSSLGTPGGMNHQPQHSQHTPLSPFPNANPQMQAMNANNVNPPPNISLASQMHLSQGLGGGINTSLAQAVSSNNLMARAPPPQRASSFMNLPQIRTVGDFQALQRTNTDMNPMGSLMMSPLGPDLDFNTPMR
ncbi:maltose fermentation regulatory protein MAL33 [Chaetomidium leptoderma]|uniref:Maltose fermentation regulatory protein MAL33 n=1 Tax=Chaetomidium leptoderma TaxID=669021 RepID=A0AAN6VTK6_9PEZI|nr:maltose fermentation regulatory protein MAL33 [Chaetomidium leptoderma]